jgi:SAM-dependent methyltransferase
VTAAEHWAAELAAWAIPEHIRAQAPESPWAFSPAVFRPPTEPTPDTVSRVRAREALPDGGSVLDVGCGGGAAGLSLVPPAGHVTGFDQSLELLDVFAAAAAQLGVAFATVHGSWPADAGSVGPADVVVTNHVAYNIPDLAAFAVALGAHARRRVVMELSSEHPRAGANDLWRHFWGVDRPTGPNADDAVAVLREAGIEPHVERSPRAAWRPYNREAQVASLRRYLCLPAERDPEIDALLDDHPRQAGEAVTLWWPGAGS